MSFTNQTTHYGLPQWIGSDKPTYLVDQNNAYQTIDSELYNANTASGEAVTTAQGAVTTAEGAASTAATALSTAQGAESTATGADTKADNAITLAQSAQTAAGAAEAAAEAAQTAAASNSITNLANAYDPTLTYNVGDLVTQDGKLYQCITQVSAPEAFDINKWDDKTTSEVYQKKISGSVFKETRTFNIAANSHATYAAALSWFESHVQDVFQLADDEEATNIAISIVGLTNPLFMVQNRRYGKNANSLQTVAFSLVNVGEAFLQAESMSITPSASNFLIAQVTSAAVTFTNKGNDSQSNVITINFDVYTKI